MRRVVGAVALGLALGIGAGCEEEPEATSPEVISLETPFRYPTELWDEGVEGDALLMVHVTDMGAVDSAYVLESSGREALDSAALAGARQLKFAPGRRGDRRIAMWAKLPVRFRRTPAQSGGSE